MSRPTPSATETLGARFVAAIEVRDRAALRSLFATPVQFRAVTPRRFWDAETPSDVADIVLGTWFAQSKQITRVSLVEDDTVGDISKITYRMSVATESGPTVVEQVAYYTVQDDRITQVRLVCSGFRPV
jgi:hypothetical protein